MHQDEICIFTPTYNRAYCLPRLFESLRSQDPNLFYWLIIDDGSTDETESIVSDFQKQADFKIIYLKQENGGKQRAFNVAIEQCAAELLMCVDSDDMVAPNAIERLLQKWNSEPEKEKYAGVVALCGKDDGEPYSAKLPNNRYINLIDLYEKYRYKGDIALAYRSDLLSLFSFEVEDNEKFISENYVFLQIDSLCKLVVLNEVVTIIEYQLDGYSKNTRAVTRANPKGYMKTKRMWFESSRTFRFKMESTILFLVGAILAQEKHPIAISPNPVMSVFGIVPAWILVKTVFRNRK